MRKFILVTGLVLLFAVEIARVYFIMPFPGSQRSNTIRLAYWVSNNIGWIRIVLALLIIWPLVYSLRHNRRWKKAALVTVLLLYGAVFYFVNFRMEADKMFHQPSAKTFFVQSLNKVPNDQLVIGIVQGNEAKAYPIGIIGYHHQVRDSIGGKPVMVTYCTVCRTGRVYSPVVNGKPEYFRLVGMDHFNAMFEDATTKSWWQQATGEAIAGELKGLTLPEIPSRQMSLAKWLTLYPASTVMQPDPAYTSKYADLKGYDNGTIDGSLEHRDTSSWKEKSWVVGVTYAPGRYKAYDWNALLAGRLVSDSMNGSSFLLTIDKDSTSFHVLNRRVGDRLLVFHGLDSLDRMTDAQTGSEWTSDGRALSGPLAGTQLENLPAYQEFWHSWKQFHPATRY